MRRAASACVAAFAALAAATPACAGETRVDFAAGDGAGERVAGYLTRPAGAGPFAAVALLHSCLGLPGNRQAIGAGIARAGALALFVDDFANRGLRETCAADFPAVRADAYAALRFLAARPDVDSARVAVVGFSQGGLAALELALAPRPPGASAASPGFAAAVAFYPPCDDLGEARFAVPTLILVGAADAVTPAEACRRLVAERPADAAAADLVVYPGAAHGFDDPQWRGGARPLGMRLAYDRVAAGRAAAAMRAFLARALAR